MHPVDFGYRVPSTVSDASALLLEHRDAMLLAGGQSLLQAANLGEVQPGVLIDITGLPELRGITVGRALHIGAGEPMSAVLRHPLVERHCPLLITTLRTVGAAAIRNRATLGGSVAWADPTSQVPGALLALDARVAVAGVDGPRDVLATEMFTGAHATRLRRGDIITQIALPLRSGSSHGLHLVRRTSITWPVAGCAAVRAGGRTRLGLFGAAPTPLLCHAVEDVDGMIEPLGDERASSEYRRAVLPVLARRAVADATRGG